MEKSKLVAPVVKWVGGKRQLITEIEKYFPAEYTKYYEPFVGGGAVLFHLQPKKAVINDLNRELINLYIVIKNNVEELIEELKMHKNEEEYFYTIRNLDRSEEYKNLSNIKRASRILYLNKTCFNGLFRVNRAGEFNTPFGKYKNPNFLNEEGLRALSTYFNIGNVEILNVDFEESLKGIRRGSFVYFDPPYEPVSDSSNFTGYTKGGFGREEQERLKRVCDRLDKRGVKFLLSNSANNYIYELYKDYKIETVKAKRVVNSVAEKRGTVDEVLVRNYE